MRVAQAPAAGCPYRANWTNEQAAAIVRGNQIALKELA
jgi:hypothetical protein